MVQPSHAKWGPAALDDEKKAGPDLKYTNAYDPNRHCKVSLRCRNNAFVSANASGNMASDTWMHIGHPELFTSQPLQDGTIALLSSHKKYVGVQNDGRLAAHSKMITDRERFHVVAVGDSTFSLQSVATKKYWSSSRIEGLSCTNEQLSRWDHFTIAMADPINWHRGDLLSKAESDVVWGIEKYGWSTHDPNSQEELIK